MEDGGRSTATQEVPQWFWQRSMADLWVVLTVVAFFGLCVAFVKGCDRIIGSDDAEDFFDDESPDPATGELTNEGVGR